jgi:hypothetical protein
MPTNAAAVARYQERQRLEATYPGERCPSFRSAASLRRPSS